MPCSQTPGMPNIAAQSAMSDSVFWVCQVIDRPKYCLNGALSLQPEGLRPITSLSTLDPHAYPYRPKTRYLVRWVPASWAALSAASNTAPRGARQGKFFEVAESNELKRVSRLQIRSYTGFPTYEMIRIFTSLFILAIVATNASAVEMPLVGIDGENVNLVDYQGNWVVVNYWATWCPPCIAEMPELQAFHDDNIGKGAMVIGINIENIGTQQLEDFLDGLFITYPIFISKPIVESELGLIPGLPTTFLVSPEGNVVARQIGPITRKLIETFIQKWEAQ